MVMEKGENSTYLLCALKMSDDALVASGVEDVGGEGVQLRGPADALPYVGGGAPRLHILILPPRTIPMPSWPSSAWKITRP